jgi:hypothetical protein
VYVLLFGKVSLREFSDGCSDDMMNTSVVDHEAVEGYPKDQDN